LDKVAPGVSIDQLTGVIKIYVNILTGAISTNFKVILKKNGIYFVESNEIAITVRNSDPCTFSEFQDPDPFTFN
jgi:hypothetical protein